MNDHDFELFKIAFHYVQEHRFARIKDSVSTLHLVGDDQNLHSEFRAMIQRVYRAVKQSYEAVQELDA
ncbi:MAG: hypothetical protein ABFS86_14235 [Planctomycetota bacterium]